MSRQVLNLSTHMDNHANAGAFKNNKLKALANNYATLFKECINTTTDTTDGWTNCPLMKQPIFAPSNAVVYTRKHCHAINLLKRMQART